MEVCFLYMFDECERVPLTLNRNQVGKKIQRNTIRVIIKLVKVYSLEHAQIIFVSFI